MSKDSKNNDYESISGKDNKSFYKPKESNKRYKENLNDPGEYPYTRGIHNSMYRGKLWTMRQFAGFGKPEETNERFKFLLKQGQTGPISSI